MNKAKLIVMLEKERKIRISKINERIKDLSENPLFDSEMKQMIVLSWSREIRGFEHAIDFIEKTQT